MMFRMYLISYFTLLFAISALDYEYPTLINPDGSIQVREFNKEQRHTFETIKKDIKFFQTEISKILPYLIKNGKVKNNTYTQEFRNFIDTQPGRRNQHFVVESFILNTKDDQLNSIFFLRKRTRLNPKMETETIIKIISNEIANEEMTSVKLQIDTHTNYTDSSNPINKTFTMIQIPSPVDRIRLLRSYRTKVEEVLRELDKLVDRKALNDNLKFSNTINDIDME